MAMRGITSVQIILSYGAQCGIEAARLLTGTGLSASQLGDHQMQIRDEQELQVLANLLAQTGEPFNVGVALGSRYHLTSYGIMGYALLASPTMRKATEVGLRYLGLTYVFSQLYLQESQNELSLQFTCDIPGDLGLLVLARDMWAVSVIQRELFDHPDIPINLCFAFPKPDGVCLDRLAKQLGGVIQFDAPKNAYMGLADLFDQPLLKANDITARICEEQCNQLLQEKQNWQPVAALVKNNLLHLGLQCSMQDIADHMARTTRTLHRQLKDEHTTWREVRDQVRMGLAEALLLKPLQLDEIAQRLGFSDSANFTHSFKRCKGLTPSAYRKQQMA